MNTSGPRLLPHGLSIQRLPTLTEVVEVGVPEAAMLSPADAVDDVDDSAPSEAAPASPIPPAEALPLDAPQLPTEAEMTARVLADVQRQVELMLEHRLREALMPALLQATDTLVMKARTELASTLRDVVSRAVTQELARRR